MLAKINRRHDPFEVSVSRGDEKSPMKTVVHRRPFGAVLLGFAASSMFAVMAYGDDSPPPEKFGREGTVKVRIPKGSFLPNLLNAEVREVADYGSFVIVECTAGEAPAINDAQVLEDENYIMLNTGAINTTLPTVRQLQGSRGQFEGKRLHLVQFAGPIRSDWYLELENTGALIVTYIPSNTYLVYGDAEQLAGVQALAERSQHIQWNGEYFDAYKIQSRALLQNSDPNDGQGNPDLYAIQLVADATANIETQRVIDRFKSAPVVKQEDVLEYRNFIVALPHEKLAAIAAQPDVVSIDHYEIPKLNDERQDQIVAGNISGSAPIGPGYMQWLVTQGFTQGQFDASNFSVDVTDSGVDNATTTPNHFGLYVMGGPVMGGTSRVKYNRLVGSQNPGSTLQGCDGHGTINAHIIAGWANTAGFPIQDSAGYHYGLGVCPFTRVGSTVIFDPNSYTFPNFSSIQSQAYNSGARISSNSWGAPVRGAYNVDSQTYDALVRDAQPTGSTVPLAGNQEMVIVFANGNDGPDPQTVGSPATAKNVISVGAAENVQAFGSADLCGWTDGFANNINDMAPFSSHGPCLDGRKKPDIVAPGTHVSGGVAQADNPAANGTALACFDAEGVCGGVASFFFPDGQELYTTSTGTSHSCPCVAGGCALIRQFFINQGMPPPSPAMTKALLMNTGRYIPGAGAGTNLWSNIQGMGEMNLGHAFTRGTTIPTIFKDEDPVNRLFTTSGQTYILSGKVISSSDEFRVTLAWTDAPGSTTGSAFQNNLDLTVVVGGNSYRGNVFTGAFSTTGGLADAQNNVEGVFVLSAPTGSPFTVTVTASNINSNGVPNLGSATDQDFALIISNAETCPALTSGPASLPDGTTGTFYNQTLTAIGGSMPYTWTVSSGMLPPGITVSSDGVLSGTPSNLGLFEFTVLARDANGCSISKSYTLRIQCRLAGDVVIKGQPVNVRACPGGVATFEVSVDSPTPLTYQWRKNEEDIAGATGRILRIESASDDDVATYDVVIKNECSEGVSNKASLEIGHPKVIGSPDAQISKTCDEITFSVEVDGIGPFSYQWRRDGVPLTDDDRIKGSQAVLLSVGPLTRSDIGVYDVVVTTSCGEILSGPAVLKVQGVTNLEDCPNYSGNSALVVGSVPCATCGAGMALSTVFSVVSWGWWRRRLRRPR